MHTTCFQYSAFYLIIYRVIIIKVLLSKYFKKWTTVQNNVKLELNIFEKRVMVIFKGKKKIQSVSIGDTQAFTCIVYRLKLLCTLELFYTMPFFKYIQFQFEVTLTSDSFFNAFWKWTSIIITLYGFTLIHAYACTHLIEK